MRILVVEDDQAIQSIVEEALSDGGFDSAIASSGEEALTLLAEVSTDCLPGPRLENAKFRRPKIVEKARNLGQVIKNEHPQGVK